MAHPLPSRLTRHRGGNPAARPVQGKAPTANEPPSSHRLAEKSVLRKRVFPHVTPNTMQCVARRLPCLTQSRQRIRVFSLPSGLSTSTYTPAESGALSGEARRRHRQAWLALGIHRVGPGCARMRLREGKPSSSSSSSNETSACRRAPQRTRTQRSQGSPTSPTAQGPGNPADSGRCFPHSLRA